MTLEAILAYVHILAILSMVVFISSEAALCRSEWMNARVVQRLGRLDLIYGIAAVLVLLSGLARTYWGYKGGGWYWTNWLLHLKLGMFVVVALMSIKPTLMYRRWRRELQATGAFEGFTSRYAVHSLVWFDSTPSIEGAIQREKQMKNWKREWKVALIEKANPDWLDLYETIL
jgi:putative membrane protein